MTNQFKNPIFWGIVLFLGGMIIGGIGWNKDESTIFEKTKGSIFMIVTGCVMIVSGLIILAKNRKK